MSIIVIQGGQTGVDRGAHIGALDNGWQIRGVMPKNGCDENGPIPADVAKHLERCLDSGLASRTRVNVEICQAVLVCVPDKDDPQATPGTALTLQLAARAKKPRQVVDPTDPEAHTIVASWIRNLMLRAYGSLGLNRDLRLMVAGPRASRWASGQVETAGLSRRLKLELEPVTSDGEAACDMPPPGWQCSRPKGHDGPCAATPREGMPGSGRQIRLIP